MELTTQNMLSQVLPLLERSEEDVGSIVVMMCGIAGKLDALYWLPPEAQNMRLTSMVPSTTFELSIRGVFWRLWSQKAL